jgi:hypothetical protein
LLYICRERSLEMEREVERQRQLDIERAKSREMQFNLDLEKEKQTQVRSNLFFRMDIISWHWNICLQSLQET